MRLMDEIRQPGRAFSEATSPAPIRRPSAPARSPLTVAAEMVGAGASFARAVREAEEQAMRNLTRYVDDMAQVVQVDWQSLAASMTQALEQFGEFGQAWQTPAVDPRNATSVLAHRAARAEAQQAGIDRVGSRKAWVSGAGLRQPPKRRIHLRKYARSLP